MNENKRILREEYVKNEMSKENYELLSEYKNSVSKLTIKCAEGHIYRTKWNHFQQGHRCPKCANITTANKQRFSQEFIAKEFEKIGYKLLSKYKNYDTKLDILCSEGHLYKVDYSHFKRGYKCPYCSNNVSDSEQKFREVIEELLEAKFPRKRPKWLVNENGNRLELDGYNEELKIAFEYQGRQHFEIVKAFKGTQKILEKTQKHDSIKKSLCKKYNIILLCPTYEMDESEYKKYILKNAE